jgi:hypothetical protein
MAAREPAFSLATEQPTQLKELGNKKLAAGDREGAMVCYGEAAASFERAGSHEVM